MPTDSIRADMFREVGSTGLVHYGGYVQEEYDPELRGIRGIRMFREMAETDAVIGAALLAIEMLCRQVKWTVEAASEEPGAMEWRQFVDECFDDLNPSFPDVVTDALSVIVYGWAWAETVYKHRTARESKYDDQRIGWKRHAFRGQDSLLRWELNETGDVTGMHQAAAPTYRNVFIPRAKSLHFRTSARKGNPEGRSLLRNAYRAWYFKKHIEQIEGIGIERDLAGLPVAYVPPALLSPDATAADTAILNAIKDIVTRIRRDEQEGVVWPLAYDGLGNKLYSLELLSTGGQRQFNTDAIITRYDQRMAMTLLADFILLGHEKVGSFALSSDKTDLFAYALGTLLDIIADEFNNVAIPRLMEINGAPRELSPRLVHGDVENVDLDSLGRYVQSLTLAGITIPDESTEYLLDQASIPHPKESGDL